MSMFEIRTLNVITFNNVSDERFKEIAANLRGENERGKVDFNRIIEMPRMLQDTESCEVESAYQMYADYMQVMKCVPGLVSESELKSYLSSKYKLHDVCDWELGKTSYKCLEKFGYISAYEWRRSRWGCEFNPMWGKVNEKEHKIYFISESDVTNLILKISEMYPDILISAVCAEHGVNGYVSAYRFLNGDIEDNWSYTPENPECFKLLTKTWSEYMFGGDLL